MHQGMTIQNTIRYDTNTYNTRYTRSSKTRYNTLIHDTLGARGLTPPYNRYTGNDRDITGRRRRNRGSESLSVASRPGFFGFVTIHHSKMHAFTNGTAGLKSKSVLLFQMNNCRTENCLSVRPSNQPDRQHGWSVRRRSRRRCGGRATLPERVPLGT